MPATQTLDASRPRSSHPTVLDKSRDIPNAEQSPAILGSSPPIGTIVIDPQILRSGSSGEDADTAPTAPVQFAVMPSPVVEKAVPGGAAADNSSSAPAPDACAGGAQRAAFPSCHGINRKWRSRSRFAIAPLRFGRFDDPARGERPRGVGVVCYAANTSATGNQRSHRPAAQYSRQCRLHARRGMDWERRVKSEGPPRAAASAVARATGGR